TTYGVLYNWTAAMDGEASSTTNPSGIQGVCPTGWHLPSDAEWAGLTNYLGGTSVAGGKLKETGTTHWASPNTDATNETGFTALPGGNRANNGSFANFGYYGYWWSATEGGTYYAWARGMYFSSYDVYRYLYTKELGFSVRCVRD
ncbi:MAG: fibrobacter succinogenes major paralogous domain-containing protein, partial [Paludibacteraceae bacterium]|nr:fibrobacter succinogenes major paralogous domain-containing protein [Paludibacteraceae bacterium]